MAIKSRNTVGALKQEVTAGTLIAPAAGTDFIPLQDGEFEMAPNFNQLENNELRGSIGSAKPILGLEEPEGSVSVYLKHSGVEGQEPQYGELIHSAFGAKEVNGTQYTTAAGSTTAIVNVGVGNGANFSRGEAVLVKDGTNGYSIRPVHSVTGDALTLGFSLANAPAAGIGLGKAVKYSVANQGHPSFSAWYYQGNAGAVEAQSGCQVTSMEMSVTAGEFINTSFSFAGSKYFYDPMEITASTNKLDFSDGSTRLATIPPKFYRDPVELAQAVQDSMNSAGSSDTFTVSYNHTGANAGKFTIATSGATLSLLWNTGANTAQTIGTKLGFLVAADDTGATTYTSDNALTLTAPYTPSYDAVDPLVAKNLEVYIGTATEIACAGISEFTFTLDNTIDNVLDICAESGVDEKLINQRTVSIDFTARLAAYDARMFTRFRANDEVRFMFAFGTKSGGNWQAGKSGCVYIPTATISSFQVQSQDNIVVINGTLTAFVDANGNGECYLNFL